jgi:hypothetical protein
MLGPSDRELREIQTDFTTILLLEIVVIYMCNIYIYRLVYISIYIYMYIIYGHLRASLNLPCVLHFQKKNFLHILCGYV